MMKVRNIATGIVYEIEPEAWDNLGRRKRLFTIVEEAPQKVANTAGTNKARKNETKQTKK